MSNGSDNKPDYEMPNLPQITLSDNKPLAIVPTTIEEVWRTAVLVARSGLAPEGMKTPEALTIAMLKGMSLGMRALDAVWSLAIINNKPTVPGDAALAIVRGKDLMEEFEETFSGEEYQDNFTAHCTVKRKGESKAYTSTFSVADAKRAGLWDDDAVVRRKMKYDGWFQGRLYKAGDWAELPNDSPWFKYPKRMMMYRARGFRFRDSFTDVLGGMHISEEFYGATIEGELAPPQQAQPPREPPPREPPVPPVPPPPPPEPPSTPSEPPFSQAYDGHAGAGEDAPFAGEPTNDALDAEVLIREAAEAFELEAGASHSEDALDSAWHRHCGPLVDSFGDVAYNSFIPIDDAARARIQIENSGPPRAA